MPTGNKPLPKQPSVPNSNFYSEMPLAAAENVTRSAKPGRLRLMYDANPMAMIVEQAGGVASTGRERFLDIAPTTLHQRVPLILGSRAEVERLIAYHKYYDEGEEPTFETPLFHKRSLFRSR